MKHLRKLSLLLALLMLSATACGPADDVDNGKDTSTGSVVDTTDSVPEGERLGLPAELRYDDTTVRLLTSENILASPKAEELTDDISALNKAMYDRTVAVEDRLGVEIEFINVVPWTDTANIVRQSIGSSSDDYDLVFTCASAQVNLVNEGLYLPISELPYVDLDKPWWNLEYINSVSLNADEPYILFGDISYNMIERTCCTYFNINLLDEKLGMKPEDIYQLVLDGEWTIDKFTELVHQVYEDVNGNTQSDEADIHGLVVNGSSAFNFMAYSSGVSFTTRNEDGYPELNMNNETTIDLVDKLCTLHFGSDSVFDAKDNHGHIQNFADGKSVFLVNRVFISGWEFLRQMEDDFGMVPNPKYDENVDGYQSAVETLVQWGTVPVTVPDPNMVSAFAEALAYYSRMYTTPAYYETTLKLKQTRDDMSMQMIDMIMDSRSTDYLYINRLNGMGDIFSSIYSAGQNTFASQYASREMGALNALNRLINEYEATFED